MCVNVFMCVREERERERVRDRVSVTVRGKDKHITNKYDVCGIPQKAVI